MQIALTAGLTRRWLTLQRARCSPPGARPPRTRRRTEAGAANGLAGPEPRPAQPRLRTSARPVVEATVRTRFSRSNARRSIGSSVKAARLKRNFFNISQFLKRCLSKIPLNTKYLYSVSNRFVPLTSRSGGYRSPRWPLLRHASSALGAAPAVTVSRVKVPRRTVRLGGRGPRGHRHRAPWDAVGVCALWHQGPRRQGWNRLATRLRRGPRPAPGSATREPARRHRTDPQTSDRRGCLLHLFL